MKRSITSYSMLALLFTLVSLPAGSVSGQPEESTTWIASGILAHYGFVPGQTLRVTCANPADTPQQDRDPRAIRFRAKIVDAQGNMLKQSDEMSVPAGQFRFVDFNRDDIAATGEARTGRLQVLVELVVEGPLQGNPTGADFPASLEIIDNSTGKTVGQQLFFQGKLKIERGL